MDNLTLHKNFKDHVNMSATELKKWLSTDDAKSVGWSKSGGKNTGISTETEGYKSGKHIVRILGKKKTELDDEDYSRMKRVISYVKRHTAQIPQQADIEHSRWRYSLMNWGHDPLKQ